MPAENTTVHTAAQIAAFKNVPFVTDIRLSQTMKALAATLARKQSFILKGLPARSLARTIEESFFGKSLIGESRGKSPFEIRFTLNPKHGSRDFNSVAGTLLIRLPHALAPVSQEQVKNHFWLNFRVVVTFELHGGWGSYINVRQWGADMIVVTMLPLIKDSFHRRYFTWSAEFPSDDETEVFKNEATARMAAQMWALDLCNKQKREVIFE